MFIFTECKSLLYDTFQTYFCKHCFIFGKLIIKKKKRNNHNIARPFYRIISKFIVLSTKHATYLSDKREINDFIRCF